MDTGQAGWTSKVLDTFFAHPHTKSWESDFLFRASHCMLSLWNSGRNAQLGCTGWEGLALCSNISNAILHWSPAVALSLLSASCCRYSGLVALPWVIYSLSTKCVLEAGDNCNEIKCPAQETCRGTENSNQNSWIRVSFRDSTKLTPTHKSWIRICPWTLVWFRAAQVNVFRVRRTLKKW